MVENSLGVTSRMKPTDLLQRFITIAPQFDAHWKSDDNYSIHDGSYTVHGVCSEFSNFFRDTVGRFSESEMKQLFDFIEDHVVEPDAEENKLDNALCTCFLENISSEECGELSKPFMGHKSRRFFDQWHSWPRS